MDTMMRDDDRFVAFEVTPMWSGDLHIESVDKVLMKHGITKELLPSAPSRATAMRRAFDQVAPRGAKVDSLPKGLGVTMSLKDVDNLDLEELSKAQGNTIRKAASYQNTLTAKILVQNINGTEVETLSFTPDDHPAVPLLREVYSVQKETYKASEDLSVWFSQKIIPALGGVGKRARGGVYYVPASNKSLLFAVADALSELSESRMIERNVGGRTFPIHLLQHGGKLCIEGRTADDAAAMEILVDGVIRDADAGIDELSAALQAPLGLRAVKSKANQAAELEAQIARWEEVTATNLDLLRSRLQELQKAIGMAELAAEAAELAKKNKS